MAEVVAVVGPTASGKTALAVALAALIGGEVVGTDSMQAYRGMDIGTATPTAAEMRRIPHHMIDCWDPREEVTVAQFQQQARACIDDVLARGRVPVVTGGSGLYVAAVLDDLRFPGTDPLVRARLESEAEAVGARALHARLAEIDPEAAAAILPDNVRRVVRALEVNEITGAPFVARLPEPVDIYSTVRIGVDIPREDLDARIAARVDAMAEAGFLGEVRALLEAGALGRTAGAALGYPQFAAAVRGDSSIEEAIAQTVAATSKFARRQQRWFRRDTRVAWLPYDDDSLAERALHAWAGTAT